MKYCKKCIMPDTRPDQIFNDQGVCNACLSLKKIKKLIGQKRKELNDIITEIKCKVRGWDCVIPSSGGKR